MAWNLRVCLKIMVTTKRMAKNDINTLMSTFLTDTAAAADPYLINGALLHGMSLESWRIFSFAGCSSNPAVHASECRASSGISSHACGES